MAINQLQAPALTNDGNMVCSKSSGGAAWEAYVWGGTLNYEFEAKALGGGVLTLKVETTTLTKEYLLYLSPDVERSLKFIFVDGVATAETADTNPTGDARVITWDYLESSETVLSVKLGIDGTLDSAKITTKNLADQTKGLASLTMNGPGRGHLHYSQAGSTV